MTTMDEQIKSLGCIAPLGWAATPQLVQVLTEYKHRIATVSYEEDDGAVYVEFNDNLAAWAILEAATNIIQVTKPNDVESFGGQPHNNTGPILRLWWE
jgi:hypothetical protein